MNYPTINTIGAALAFAAALGAGGCSPDIQWQKTYEGKMGQYSVVIDEYKFKDSSPRRWVILWDADGQSIRGLDIDTNSGYDRLWKVTKDVRRPDLTGQVYQDCSWELAGARYVPIHSVQPCPSSVGPTFSDQQTAEIVALLDRATSDIMNDDHLVPRENK